MDTVKIISIVSSLEVAPGGESSGGLAINALFQTFLTCSHNVNVYQTCFVDSPRDPTGLEFGQIDTILAGSLLVVRLFNEDRAQISRLIQRGWRQMLAQPPRHVNL